MTRRPIWWAKVSMKTLILSPRRQGVRKILQSFLRDAAWRAGEESLNSPLRGARAPARRAALAQPVEHRIRNAGVRCSSHLGGTILPKSEKTDRAAPRRGLQPYFRRCLRAA